MTASLAPALAKTRKASRVLATLSGKVIDDVLVACADALEASAKKILAANAKDLKKMDPKHPNYDRLQLTDKRLRDIAHDMRTVAALPSPLHRVLEQRTLPNGLRVRKVSVPLGVVGIIYEARPNVTADAFSLCFKSGNACVLKGGSDAAESSKAIISVIVGVLKKHRVDPAAVLLLPPERSAVQALLKATDAVDVLIPRGGQGLIRFVRENARVPVIETGAGIVHVYVDASADIAKAAKIVDNSKTRRVSVCNALDTLIVHKARLKDLKTVVADLAGKKVELFADPAAFLALKEHYPTALLKKAKPTHFGTEFLSLKMSIKTVANIDAALAHVARYGSKHSETIVAEDAETIRRYLDETDAAAVYANASTAFTDGAQFGMGAEIGISTQKLHARGPMGLQELTSVKWLVEGSGHVRP